VFAPERLTGALLDRLTHHVHILEMDGDSYRLKQSKRRSRGICDPGRDTPSLTQYPARPPQRRLPTALPDALLLRPADAFLLRR
jgi:hypothetical protein